MREIGTQLREYLDATAPEVSMTEIVAVLDSPESVQPARPESGGVTSDERQRRPGVRFSGNRWWIALAAAVAAILLIGLAARFFVADDVVVEPDETTATSNSAEDGSPAIPEESPRAIPADVIEPPVPGLSRATGGTPLPDIENAVLADDGAPALPPGAVNSLPNEDRLDFLFELCNGPNDCFRDAHFMDPADSNFGSGPWPAGRPFHIRHGFVNPNDEPLGPGFDVVVYATPMDVPSEFGGVEGDQTLRYTSDFVLRGETDRCGPTYKSQTGPVTCEWFVHDFSEGLPEGRWAMWAVWEAPCAAWVELEFTDVCADPSEVVSLFSSGVDSPFTPPDAGPPPYGEPDMARLTPAEMEEMFGPFEEMGPDMGDDGEAPPPPGPEVEIDASGAAATGGTPLPDFDAAIPGDDEGERLPEGAVTELAYPDRLNFLVEQCYEPDSCFRDAFFVNPDDPSLVSAAWQGGRPFHVRHGFINDGAEPLGPEFDVVLYSYQWDDFAARGTTYRYTSDYVLRGLTDQCGPTYRSSDGPVTCEWFVHEFPAGLPAGRHAVWAFWEAACWAWLEYGFVDRCEDPDEVMSHFASGVDSPWDSGEVTWENYFE